MNDKLFTNWHLMRWIALAIGLFFIVQGLRYQDWVSGLVGGFFLFQAATNTGCLCGRCAVSAQSSKSESTNISDVAFTEIKEDYHGRDQTTEHDI
ncbi:MAG: hypothetical protein U5J63_14045 [Fodinibius sp.]|nr:hypothetical protein [Fodinibius sp.]